MGWKVPGSTGMLSTTFALIRVLSTHAVQLQVFHLLQAGFRP